MTVFDKTYDKWNWQRIRRHISYWLAWLVFYAVVNVNSYGEGNLGSWVLLELCVLPVKLGYTYFLVYGVLPKYGQEGKYLQFILIAVLLSVLGGFIFRAIDIHIISGNLLPFREKGDLFSFMVAYKALDLLFVASLVVIIKFIQKQIQNDKHTKELQQQQLKSELQYLKHQLQPHFFFNTLNNLYGMILSNDRKAADVVIKLSEIMNYMLYESDGKFIPLQKEVLNLRNYIELEKIRYGNKVDVSFDIVGNIEGKMIAPLILISFVENAFKHGAAKNHRESWITILLEINEKMISFQLENNFSDDEVLEKHTTINSGIGLNNVKKRLDLIYPDEHDLDIKKSDTYLTSLKIYHKSDKS